MRPPDAPLRPPSPSTPLTSSRRPSPSVHCVAFEAPILSHPPTPPRSASYAKTKETADAQLGSALSAQISDLLDGSQLLESSQRRLKHLRQSLGEVDRLCGETGFLIERYDLISALSQAREAPQQRSSAPARRKYTFLVGTKPLATTRNTTDNPARVRPVNPPGQVRMNLEFVVSKATTILDLPKEAQETLEELEKDGDEAELWKARHRPPPGHATDTSRRRRLACSSLPCFSRALGGDDTCGGVARMAQVHEQLCALEAKCVEAKRVQKIDDSIPWRRAGVGRGRRRNAGFVRSGCALASPPPLGASDRSAPPPAHPRTPQQARRPREARPAVPGEGAPRRPLGRDGPSPELRRPPRPPPHRSTACPPVSAR